VIELPRDDVGVLECTVLPTGDQTGRLLGDLGAQSIKVEQPGGVMPLRRSTSTC
jgi:crotonobetainyl-CoA:carnitine CoA-transferase CaiB-like acyl-CoA transferase